MEQRSTADQLTPTKREPQMFNNIIMFGLAYVVVGITLTVASFKLAEQNRQTAKLFEAGFVLLVLLIDLTYLSTTVRLRTGLFVLCGFVTSILV